jgi:hypothetical protein
MFASFPIALPWRLVAKDVRVAAPEISCVLLTLCSPRMARSVSSLDLALGALLALNPHCEFTSEVSQPPPLGRATSSYPQKPLRDDGRADGNQREHDGERERRERVLTTTEIVVLRPTEDGESGEPKAEQEKADPEEPTPPLTVIVITARSDELGCHEEGAGQPDCQQRGPDVSESEIEEQLVRGCHVDGEEHAGEEHEAHGPLVVGKLVTLFGDITLERFDARV